MIFNRSIYHFDPSNLPPCTKLQITNNASPANTPSPTLSSSNENSNNGPSRKKNHKQAAQAVNVSDEPVVVVQRTTEICDRENVSTPNVTVRDENDACKPEIEVSTELEVAVPPEPTKNISMNSLLSPLNQSYQEPQQDNNLDRKADGMKY